MPEETHCRARVSREPWSCLKSSRQGWEAWQREPRLRLGWLVVELGLAPSILDNLWPNRSPSTARRHGPRCGESRRQYGCTPVGAQFLDGSPDTSKCVSSALTCHSRIATAASREGFDDSVALPFSLQGKRDLLPHPAACAGDHRDLPAQGLIHEELGHYASCRTERMFPAGSLNQAMSGPWLLEMPRAMPLSSVNFP